MRPAASPGSGFLCIERETRGDEVRRQLLSEKRGDGDRLGAGCGGDLPRWGGLLGLGAGEAVIPEN